MDSTLNSMSNPRFDQTQNLNKPNTKETSKSYYMMSSFQNTSKKLYSQRDKELLINQQYYDPEVLKKQLNNCKTKIHEQKSTFLNLKIRYGKLYNENMNNKNLISNILGTPLDKYVTKEEVLDKIENAKLTESKKAKLQEALDSIILRLNIEEKKENKAFNVLVRAKLRKQRIHTIITPDELSRFHKNLTNVLYINFIKEEKKKKEKQMPVKKMSKTQKRFK